MIKIYGLTGKNAFFDSNTNGQTITLFTIYKIHSSEKSFVEILFKFSTVHFKMYKISLYSSATYYQGNSVPGPNR
jgi:hypothetical protein